MTFYYYYNTKEEADAAYDERWTDTTISLWPVKETKIGTKTMYRLCIKIVKND